MTSLARLRRAAHHVQHLHRTTAQIRSIMAHSMDGATERRLRELPGNKVRPSSPPVVWIHSGG